MPVVVSLKEVVDAIDSISAECETYLHPKTGEIVLVTEEDRSMLTRGDLDDLPEWQRETVAKAREVEESDEYLQLPDQFEIHDWSIMKDFCDTVENPDAREALLDAVHGKSAFRQFRHTADRLGILKAWFQYRQAALERIAREWLEAHEIAYK